MACQHGLLEHFRTQSHTLLPALGLTANHICCLAFPFTLPGREHSTDLTFPNLPIADLVSFPVAVIKYPDERNIKVERIYSAYNSTPQSFIAEKSRRQDLEAVSFTRS